MQFYCFRLAGVCHEAKNPIWCTGLWALKHITLHPSYNYWTSLCISQKTKKHAQHLKADFSHYDAQRIKNELHPTITVQFEPIWYLCTCSHLSIYCCITENTCVKSMTVHLCWMCVHSVYDVHVCVWCACVCDVCMCDVYMCDVCTCECMCDVHVWCVHVWCARSVHVCVMCTCEVCVSVCVMWPL